LPVSKCSIRSPQAGNSLMQPAVGASVRYAFRL
jgi:hypothetical protein